VTPTSNAGRFLDKTISSVLNQQGNFDIEYILVDNLSTDNTLEIAESYRDCLARLNSKRGGCHVSMKIVSDRDNSMYEAINKGFALATGDILAWINADDYYLPGAFDKVANVFARRPEVKWLKGITSYVDEGGENVAPGKCYLYAQNLIRRGLYGREAYFIQQDSVFWRFELWRSVGGLDQRLKLAGDYDLWRKFAYMEPLYSLRCPISCFRRVKGQLSEDLQAYRKEQEKIETRDDFRSWLIRKYFSAFEKHLPNGLNFKIFRFLYPSEPLYYIDLDTDLFLVKSSNKYIL
jgi:glycosyltransferase involved in cell wall biosynthesis